jgi:hypothetical protein
MHDKYFLIISLESNGNLACRVWMTTIYFDSIDKILRMNISSVASWHFASPDVNQTRNGF